MFGRREIGSFARRFFIVLAVLAVIRLLLPYALKAYVNRTIDDLEGYEGEISSLDLNLWRGAYEIEGLVIRKADADPDADPFVRVRKLDLEIQWSALFTGRVVGEVVCHHPLLNFRTKAAGEEGPGEGGGEEQTGAGATWTTRLDQLFPFRINRFVIRDGEIRWREEGEDPVDLYMTDFYLEALNVSNVRGESKEEVLLAEIEAAGRPFGTGEFEARLRFDPLADPLRFELDAAVRKVDVIDLNDFLEAYGSLDAEAGTFSAYSEFAASDGRVEGYVKPLFEGLEVLSFSEVDDPGDALELLWEGMVSIAAEVFTNPPTNRLATKVALEGRTDQPNTDVFAAVGSLLRNAFIAALRPAIDDTVDLHDLDIVVPEAGEEGKAKPKREEAR